MEAAKIIDLESRLSRTEATIDAWREELKRMHEDIKTISGEISRLPKSEDFTRLEDNFNRSAKELAKQSGRFSIVVSLVVAVTVAVVVAYVRNING